jgi:hypothetical protein
MDRDGNGGNGSSQVQTATRCAGRTRWSLVLITMGALLLPASLAEARIVPQKGIQGINLNMTRARVIQEKGQPDSEKIVPNEILGRQRVMRYGKTRVAFSGVRNRSRVISIRTRDRRQRTRSGVGVGSTETAVENGVQGVRCRTEFGSRHCFKGQFRPGRRVTDFSLSSAGRVTRVTVAIVID